MRAPGDLLSVAFVRDARFYCWRVALPPISWLTRNDVFIYSGVALVFAAYLETLATACLFAEVQRALLGAWAGGLDS